MKEKPFLNSYWVIPGSFLAGGYPASTEGIDIFSRLRLEALAEAGFNSYFDLTRVGELPAYLPLLEEEARRYNLEISYERFPTMDKSLMPPEQMRLLINAIDAALSAGRKVYLHCWGGVGRTGTAVGCWLASHGFDGEAALQRLNELYQDSEQKEFYPRSPETDAQAEYILSWKGNS